VATPARAIEEQGSWLRLVVTGWFAYSAVPVNVPSLCTFWDDVIWHRRRALRRRVQLDKTSWSAMTKLANRWRAAQACAPPSSSPTSTGTPMS
jgi:hypothetical protein